MWLPHALGWLLLAATAGLVVVQGDSLGRRAILALSAVVGFALMATFVALVTA